MTAQTTRRIAWFLFGLSLAFTLAGLVCLGLSISVPTESVVASR